MKFLNEQQEKISNLYSKLEQQKEAKKILERAMHSNFYDKELYHRLFVKLLKLNDEIKDTKEELLKERKNYEKSRQGI